MTDPSDVEVVTQLVLHERQARDRRWWDRMRAQYWPDATVHLSWFAGNAWENVDASAAMNADRSVSVHRLSPAVVHVAGDRALAELPTVIETLVVVDGVDAILQTYLRIEYRAERRASEWRISQLDTIYERDLFVPTTPGQSARIDPADLEPYRAPFRLLGWFLAARGHSVLDDLIGEDRPEDVAAFYAREFEWLRAS